jgi:hypothetical protein
MGKSAKSEAKVKLGRRSRPAQPAQPAQPAKSKRVLPCFFETDGSLKLPPVARMNLSPQRS